MANNRSPHIVKVGSIKFGISLPNIYESIGDTVGVTPARTTDATGVGITAKSDFPATVKTLRAGGGAITLTVRTESGRSHRVLCSMAKVSTAITGLVDLTIPESGNLVGDLVLGTSKKIVHVSIPRRRFRY
jgi:hypothetical protein